MSSCGTPSPRPAPAGLMSAGMPGSSSGAPRLGGHQRPPRLRSTFPSHCTMTLALRDGPAQLLVGTGWELRLRLVDVADAVAGGGRNDERIVVAAERADDPPLVGPSVLVDERPDDREGLDERVSRLVPGDRRLGGELERAIPAGPDE